MKPTIFTAMIIAFLLSLTSTIAVSSEKTLYERIGGEPKVRAIVEDIWNNHSANPIVKDRFAKSNPGYVKQMVFEIFAAATGATDVKYNGKDMKSAHAGMNISEMEFNAVVDDVLAACASHGVEQQELNEILAILWSVRKDIVNSHIITDTLVKADTHAESKEHNTDDVDLDHCLKSHDC